MFCLLISQVMPYVREDTNKLPPSTLVGQNVWYAAHWCVLAMCYASMRQGLLGLIGLKMLSLCRTQWSVNSSVYICPLISNFDFTLCFCICVCDFICMGRDANGVIYGTALNMLSTC